MNRISYQECPCCGNADIYPVLQATDYTVSRETFAVWECKACTNRFTQQIPDTAAIGAYYQSQEYVSHSETRQGLVNRLYHAVRNHTLQTKRKLIQTVTGKAKGQLLDVGAGTGAFAAVMQNHGWQVTGLEPDDTARANALRYHRLQLLPQDTLFTLPASTFDAITLWHVLEHVQAVHVYLKAFHRLLQPGGKLLVAVPNYTSRDAQQYGPCWAAYDVPRHLYHFSPAGMRLLAAQHGFRITSLEPMWFDSYYVSMLSERYRTGKNNYLRALLNGFRSNRAAARSPERCSSVIYLMEKA